MPNDDVGSETMARYDYQISLTAVSCVELLDDDTIVEIVCEWEEDFIVVRDTGHELVSVKHLEPSKGPWSLATLLEAGGLKHLFERWKKSDKKASCRLQTNGGLKTGAKEASAIANACRGVEIDDAATLIANRIGAEDADEARQFLVSLTIESELPKRDDLMAKLLVDVLPPFCKRLGWPPDEIKDRFEAIRVVVAEAARSDLRSEARAVRIGSETETASARALAKKTVTRAKVAAAIERVTPVSPSTMVEKLEKGGLGPTEVERCKRLRADWLETENRWDPGLPGPSASADIRRRVQDLAAQAEAKVRPQGGAYGDQMRSELIGLSEQAQIKFEGQPVDTDLLLGAAYDETDRCRIWWSDRFTPKSGVA
jgi:hypothetical protein